MGAESAPILVPLDGSETSERALPFAVAISTRLGRPMLLMSVVSSVSDDMRRRAPDATSTIAQCERERSEAYLASVRDRHAPSVRITTRVAEGDPSEEIGLAIKDIEPFVVVLSTHGRSGISRWRYGSTAGQLLHAVTTPLFAVGPLVQVDGTADVRLRRILVPLDGSEETEGALGIAQEFAGAFAGKLELVRVVRFAAQTFPYNMPEGYAYFPEIDQIWEHAAADYIAAKQSQYAPVIRAATLLRGDVAAELLQYVDQHAIDLVVMLTHARRGPARVALGSVADRMLHGAAPVLLLRPATS